uniref:Uncharacterized protein n=1 Tax=Sinocyclocheilus rhinocerous TaxID=307959 RepID=A0A673GXT4_9TELE
MALTAILLCEQFICPVCLDLLKDPVAIACGHSYCMSCITDCWDQEDQKRVYSCPQCRQTFSPRPSISKNTMLAEVVEKLKKTKLKAAVPAPPGDVECDICTGRKHKAVKSCLVCLESYCQTHFERHQEFRSGKRHKVIDATERLDQEKTAVSRAEGQMERLEQEIEDLKSKSLKFENLDRLDRYQLTLDPNTAHKCLSLSEGNRVVTCTGTVQPYPDHPDRFDYYPQVLCTECVGSVYGVGISVSYKSISRKGSGYECFFGFNDQSWSLSCSPSSFSFWHNNKQTKLPVPSSCSRIGVYVDHSAGTLCFYSVSDTTSLIHTVQTTFTQPLYPGFNVYGRQSSAKLLEVKCRDFTRCTAVCQL